jgi:hypothetical protein
MNFLGNIFAKPTELDKIVYDLNKIVEQYEINVKDKDVHKIKYNFVMKELRESSIDKTHEYIFDYIYGWALARGELKFEYSKEFISIEITNDDEYKLFNNLCNYLDNKNYYIDYNEFLIFIKRYYLVIRDVNLIKLFKNYAADNIINRSKYFYRGYFEAADSTIMVQPGGLECKVFDDYTERYFSKYIEKYCGIKLNNNAHVWYDMDALEFLSDLYNYDSNILSSIDELLQLSSNVEKIQEAKLFKDANLPPQFIYNKVHKDAVFPYKIVSTDTGFNLHLVSKIKEESGVHYFTTGIQIISDYGYYLEIYGQDLYKHGYILATGGPMILDNKLNDEIIVPLLKINNLIDSSEPIIVKLVPKKLCLGDITSYSSVLDDSPLSESVSLSQ